MHRRSAGNKDVEPSGGRHHVRHARPSGEPTPPTPRPADQLPESLEEMGQKLRKDQIEFDLRNVKDGIVLHFDAGSFVPARLGRSQRRP